MLVFINNDDNFLSPLKKYNIKTFGSDTKSNYSYN